MNRRLYVVHAQNSKLKTQNLKLKTQNPAWQTTQRF